MPRSFRPRADSVTRISDWVGSWRDPQLAICIPTKDRLDLLVPCLESLARTAAERRVQVLIGDTGSSRESREFYAQLGVPVVDIPECSSHQALTAMTARITIMAPTTG